MKKIKIALEILSPIEAPKFPIHLDGLLYWAIIEHTDLSESQALTYLDTVLDKANGIYKASQMLYTRSTSKPIFAVETTHPTTTNWNEFALPINGKAGTIVTKTGHFRKKMTTRNAYAVGWVEFFAVGDVERIHYLLELLGFIGLSNKQGFGEIGEIHIEEIENDYSFFLEDGSVARNLPISMLPSDFVGIKQLLPITPPYSTSPKTLSALPEFTLINY